jgi:hypothetical protein
MEIKVVQAESDEYSEIGHGSRQVEWKTRSRRMKITLRVRMIYSIITAEDYCNLLLFEVKQIYPLTNANSMSL